MFDMKRTVGSGRGVTVLLTLLAPVSWGTTYVTVSELLGGARPLLVAALRVLPAGLVLLALRARTPARSTRPPARWPWRLVVLSACNFGIFLPLLIVAVHRMPGGVAASFGGLQPLLVAAIGFAAFGRRVRRGELVAAVLAAVGVALVVVRPGAGFDLVGVLAALGATGSFATGVVLTKAWPPPADRVRDTGWQLLVAGVPLLLLALLVDGAPARPDLAALVGYAHLSMVGTALAYVLWFRGIERLPATAPPLLGLAAPLTGAVLGWVVRGEGLSVVQIGGFVLATCSVAWGVLGGARHQAVMPPSAGITAPVMMRASSLARNASTLASSSGA